MKKNLNNPTHLKQFLRHGFLFKGGVEAPPRSTTIKRRTERKQAILKAGCAKANEQALRRKAERRLIGHIVTPLHA